MELTLAMRLEIAENRLDRLVHEVERAIDILEVKEPRFHLENGDPQYVIDDALANLKSVYEVFHELDRA